MGGSNRGGGRGFYPRLREGGDRQAAEVMDIALGFYPRLREGGDR